MLKTILSLTLVTSIVLAKAQVPIDTLIEVSGKILSARDSSFLTANILYEKLPYYDDMGITSTSPDGSYSIPLVKGNQYNVIIKKDGYLDYSREVRIIGSDADLSQTEDFYVHEIEVIKLENLIFARGSDRITESSYEELNGLVVWLTENPEINVQLEGHTDFQGNAEANMRLSEARVLAVKEYLVKQGIDSPRMLTKAFGGSQPVTRARSNEARALNRRVEVRILHNN